jgi:hypothetical protein
MDACAIEAQRVLTLGYGSREGHVNLLTPADLPALKAHVTHVRTPY